MILTSWIKYGYKIEKIIIYVNFMLIYVNYIEKIFFFKFYKKYFKLLKKNLIFFLNLILC